VRFERRSAGRALVAVGVAAILIGGLGLLATGGGGATGGVAPTAGASTATPNGAASAGAEPNSSIAPAEGSHAQTGPAPSSSTPGATAASGPTTRPAETVASFLARWTAAFRAGDTAFLLARLNPIVIARYGEPACLQAINRQVDPAEVNVLRGTSGPAPWTWVASDLTARVADVYAATIDRTYRGETTLVTFHFALVNGTLTWFDACGAPLP